MKPRWIWLVVFAMALTGGATLAQETADEPEVSYWLPENVSAQEGAHEIDSLFHIILWITGIALVGVEALLLYFVFKYRRQEGVKAHYTHGNNRLEVIWTAVPTAILIVLALMNQNIWAKLRGEVPPGAFTVEVMGKQFNWVVRYPGPDGELGTGDDVEGLDLIRVPAGRPIHLKLGAEDVLHSFFLPNLRFKRDAVPGLVSDLWFEVEKPGQYEIACAEFCGFGHYTMGGYLFAMEPAEFEAWLRAAYGQPESTAVAAVRDTDSGTR